MGAWGATTWLSATWHTSNGEELRENSFIFLSFKGSRKVQQGEHYQLVEKVAVWRLWYEMTINMFYNNIIWME